MKFLRMSPSAFILHSPAELLGGRSQAFVGHAAPPGGGGRFRFLPPRGTDGRGLQKRLQLLPAIGDVPRLISVPLACDHKLPLDRDSVAILRDETGPHLRAEARRLCHVPAEHGLTIHLVDVLPARPGARANENENSDSGILMSGVTNRNLSSLDSSVSLIVRFIERFRWSRHAVSLHLGRVKSIRHTPGGWRVGVLRGASLEYIVWEDWAKNGLPHARPFAKLPVFVCRSSSSGARGTTRMW